MTDLETIMKLAGSTSYKSVNPSTKTPVMNESFTGYTSEAIGDSAEALYALQDDLGLGDNVLVDELARYLSADQIEEFVADFRRNHDMNRDMEEADSIEEGDDFMSTDPEGAWKAIAARKKELMNKGMEPEEAQDQAAEEIGVDPEELEAWLATNESVTEGRMSDMNQDAQEMTREEFIATYGASHGVHWDRVHDDEDMRESAPVAETVNIPVTALEELMKLAGYGDYKAKISEYENDPEEEYMDAEEQLIGLSGGLNEPKGAYISAAGGDNPMNLRSVRVKENAMGVLESKLTASYKTFLAGL